MKANEIQELIKQVVKSGVEEVIIETKDLKLRIVGKATKKKETVVEIQPTVQPITQPATIQVPQQIIAAPVQEIVAPPTPLEESKGKTADESNWVSIKSPMIGTYYASPSPDKPVFVKVGDEISIGTPICIIEAMKLFNEIESEVSGKVMKILVKDGDSIEHDMPLVLIAPN